MTAIIEAPEPIEIKDVGPIAHELIPLRPGGGLVVIKGDQGTGKSKTLEAINAIATGNLRGLEKRDGSQRGEIRWGEARVTIVKRPTASGPELAVSTLEGRGLSLADLVDPQIKDPEKADAWRIKALVQLAGGAPDITMFHHLATDKEEFDAVVAPDAAEIDDIVEMAAKVKRDFELASRKAADQAENFTGNALGHREAGLGYDPEIEADSAKLQGTLEAAIRELQRLESESASAASHNAAIVRAQQAIEASKASVFPTVDASRKAETEASAAVAAQAKHVASLEEMLRDARKKLAMSEAAHAAAVRDREGAEQHAKTLAAWSETADLQPVAIDPRAIEQAQAKVAEARSAVERGALQRDKAARMAKAELADKLALECRHKAERLRDAAKGADEVLSGLVGRCTNELRVERGRMVTTTDRGTECFAELSEGERWRMAFKIGVDALVRRGVAKDRMLIVLPQWAYGEWSPRTRRMIDEYSRQHGVHAVAALATDDPVVHAESFG